jgi:cysteinyl-tRNA synthetase
MRREMSQNSPEPFKLYNTLTRTVEEFKPQKEGHIGLYVCGMTVYDHIHIGHARAMVVFDSIVRYLRYRGWQVSFVRNFTDVDDKIIERAQVSGEPPLVLAQRYIDAFHEDTDALGLIRPDEEPRVSECIPQIHSMIAELVEKGSAYVADGTVWFQVENFKDYGKLSGQKVDELRSPDTVAGKRAPADFALWKAVKDGEPSWESPWGPGRPGWHIECSAMAMHCIGKTVDIHGGGLDLVFPHHENEIAQSECAHQQEYVRYWMHNGMLNMSGGQKMGKSLGNVINVRDALLEFPAEALRLYYLQNHYRSPIPWSNESLIKSLAMLARLYDAKEIAESMQGEGDPDRIAKEMGKEAQVTLELGRKFKKRFLTTMSQDFNTAQALGHLCELARAINRFSGLKKARKRGGPIVVPALEAYQLVNDALGIISADTRDFQEEVKAKRVKAMGLDPKHIEDLLQQRITARTEKDWGRADAIRAELSDSKVVVMDTPEGVQWRISLCE